MFKRISKSHLTGGGISLIILVLAFAVIWGAWRDSKGQEPTMLDNAEEIYTLAVVAMEGRDALYYRVEGTLTTTKGNTTLTEDFRQLISWEGRNTEQIKVCIDETRSIDDYEIHRVNYYADGNEYLIIQDTCFVAPVAEEAFEKKYTPAVLIDPTLYTNVIGTTTKKAAKIDFSNPAHPESWSAPTGAELVSAEGIAHLNEHNQLTRSNYSLTYQLADVQISVHYTVEILTDQVPTITIPDISTFTPISCTDTPYMLEKACGYLMNTSSIHAEYSDTIFCQAFGDERTQNLIIATDDADGWSAQVDTSISVSNSSQAGVVATTTKAERFTNNIYTVSIDGGNFAENTEVDLDTMTSYCKNLLIGTMLMPKYIIDANCSQTETMHCMTFTASRDFAQILAEEACTTLYQDTSVLKDMAQTSTTDIITCYLNVDVNSGFPVSSGFYYQETYTISGIPYKLSFKADQTYIFS